MAKLLLSLPFNYTEAEIKTFLDDRDLTHIKKHDLYWIRIGDALKTKTGIIARVMDKMSNEVQEPFIVIASNKLSSAEMHFHFDNPSGMALEVYEEPEEIKCPSCSSREYDTQECAECGYSVHVKGSGL